MNTVEFLQIEVTTRCNFSCTFCCGRHMRQGDMLYPVYSRALEKFSHVTHIGLQGEGESLLHPRFFDMAGAARDRGISVSLFTNGSLLSAETVPRILDTEIVFIRCSLESADAAVFQKLRGGDLGRIKEGIKRLVDEREGRSLRLPVVGLAVTVMRSTRGDIPSIVSLYRELDLDGGLFFQPLQSMDAYTAIYPPDLKAEVLSPVDIAALEESYSRSPELAAIFNERSPLADFYEQLSQGFDPTRDGCPWLARAMYIDYRGYVLPCCRVKQADRYAFGHIEADSAKALLSARRAMRQRLVERLIPECCRGCAFVEPAAQA